MGDLSHREKKLILAFSLTCIVFAGLLFGRDYREKAETSSFIFEEKREDNIVDTSKTQNENVEEEAIFIHISGAVARSGLLELSSKSRLIDAIEAAGGANEDADLDQVNLSRKLHDEERIHIPKKGESQNPVSLVGSEASSLIKEKVNINTCDKNSLMELPGIGDKTAEKIINYREKMPFGTIEDLKEVPGIGDKKFEELKDEICI